MANINYTRQILTIAVNGLDQHVFHKSRYIFFLAKRYISLELQLYKRKGLVIRAKGFYSNNK